MSNHLNPVPVDPLVVLGLILQVAKVWRGRNGQGVVLKVTFKSQQKTFTFLLNT